MYPAKLDIRDTTENTHSVSYLGLLLSIGRDFKLPFMTNEMISISISQTFRSREVIFHLRRPLAFLSLSLYDTPGLAPRMNTLCWEPGDFQVSYSNKDISLNAWNRHSGTFMVDTGTLCSNMNSPSHEYYMTFWPLISYSDSPTDWTFHITNFPFLSTLLPILTFTDLRVFSMEILQWVWHASRERLPLRTPCIAPFWGLAYALIIETSLPTLHRFYDRNEPDLRWERFPWSICRWYDMPTRSAYPSGHLALSPVFWDLLMHQLVRLVFPNLPCRFSTFRHKCPSVLSRFCFQHEICKTRNQILVPRTVANTFRFRGAFPE